MNKIIFFEKNNIDKESRKRITLQLRAYDENGEYHKIIGNATLHFKGLDIKKAFEILKNSLFNSKHLSEYFEVED